jgi:hypothetical protein
VACLEPVSLHGPVKQAAGTSGDEEALLYQALDGRQHLRGGPGLAQAAGGIHIDRLPG